MPVRLLLRGGIADRTVLDLPAQECAPPEIDWVTENTTVTYRKTTAASTSEYTAVYEPRFLLDRLTASSSSP
jgi:hypothetical protein